jgi:hypothetical protein
MEGSGRSQWWGLEAQNVALEAVLWIRIRIRRIRRIRMFLGLRDPHPDPLVTTYKYEFGSGPFHHPDPDSHYVQ